MLGKPDSRKLNASFTLAALLASTAMMVAPDKALAQFADMLSDPGQSTTTLRNPLIPGAPYANAGQAAAPGQPPPIGNGPIAPAHIPGDLGAPSAPPSGIADPTHGNIFPTRDGGGPVMPWEYIPGIGRHQTENGQEQGVINNGGAARGSTGMGPGGQMLGTTWMNNGGAAVGSTGMGPGGKNGGTDWVNNGGAAPGATDMGPGGQMMGTSWMNNGGAAAGSTGMGPGGKNGGTDWVNNGGAAPGASDVGWGGKSNGTAIMNNGGAAANAMDANAGGKSNGTGVVNNGGDRPNAVQSGDVNRVHALQPSMYDYQGPLPTVRIFGRYLVILGVVAATVFMAMAAWGMVCGAPYAGSRVIGAAAGLILMMGSYTIWKIVQMNTFHGNSTGWWSQYQNGQRITGGGQAGQPYTVNNNTGGGNAGNAGGGNAGNGNGGNNGTIGGLLNGGGNAIGGGNANGGGAGQANGGTTTTGGIPGGANGGGGGTIGSMLNNTGPIPNPPSGN